MKKFIPVLMALFFAIAFSCSFALTTAPGYAQEDIPECTSLKGSNINSNNQTGYWSSPVYSYLVSTGNQYMRVQGFSNRGSFSVVYYDKEFNTVSRVDVEAELPIFGGFYSDGSNYYVVSGQTNTEESNDTEVYRITKYDSNWNRLGYCSLKGANTYVPFDAGSCRMTHSGNMLIVNTCHTMYAGSDGLHHQANVMIVVDTDNMTVTRSRYSVGSQQSGYVSHSFNQFVEVDGSKVITVDHGDTYPRGVCLNEFNMGYVYSLGETIAFTVGGQAKNNYTGASVGGFEVSSSSYLIAVNSINQDNFSTSKTRNVFIATVDKSTKEVTRHQLTSIPEGSASAGTPHIVKTASNQYMVLWYQSNKVKYVMINQNGEPTSEIYSMDGNLSDCVPIVDDGAVVWYTWKNTKETIYKIPLNDLGNPEQHAFTKGHLYELEGSVEGGLANVTCSRCHEHAVAKVPTSATIWWNKPSSSSSSSYIPSDLEANSVVEYRISGIGYSATADLALDDFLVESSDPENCVVDTDNQTVLFKKGGNYTVTFTAKYNPSFQKEYSVYILKTLEGVQLTTSKEGLDAPGTTVKLTATPDGGRGSLEYKFFVIDSEGQETLLKTATTAMNTAASYNWTPSKGGDYRLSVDLTDTSDNHEVSSNIVDFHVHDYKWLNTENGIATLKCDFCNSTKQGKVPVSFSLWWRDTASSDPYYRPYSQMKLDIGSTVAYMTDNETYSGTSDITLSGYSVEIDQPEGYVISRKTIKFNTAGIYQATVFPTYNPELKKTCRFIIVKPLTSVNLTTTPESQQMFGHQVKLIPVVDGGKGTLKYTYTVTDSAGQETVLATDTNSAQYDWTPPATGNYKLRVQVKDTGDNNNTMSSTDIDYVITKAPRPSVWPQQQYNVPYSVSQLSNDILANTAGWTFEATDIGTNLTAGGFAQFTVHYTAADAGNYENVETTVTVTRAACDHSSMKYHAAVPFTCTANGNTAYWECESCGHFFEEEAAQNEIEENSWIVQAHHVLTEHAAKAPTCSAAGNVKYWQCDVCSKYFSDASGNEELVNGPEIPIDSNAHSWAAPTYVWSADNSTVTATRVCNHNNAHKQTEDAATTHTTTKAATCTETGTEHYKSAAFNNSAFAVQEKDVEIAKLPHPWNNGTVTKAATCSEPGEKSFECTACDATKTEPIEIDQNAHDWAAPTYVWSADNSTVTATRVCNHNSAHKQTEKVGTTHVTKEEATCTKTGVDHYTSATFDNDAFEAQGKDVVTPMLPHSWDDGTVTKAATCSEPGEKSFECTACDATKTEPIEIDSNAHDWGAPTFAWSDDNTVTATRVCNHNSAHKQTEDAAVTHTTTKAATCTEKGIDHCVASAFGAAEEKDVETPKLPHPWNDGTVTKTPTCSEEGEIYYECTACDATKTEPIAKDTINGHRWNEGVVTKEPKCNNAGVRTFTCELCGDKYTEAIDKTGHTPGEVVIENEVPATCTADGSYDEVIYCTTCGAVISRETKTDPSPGHAMQHTPAFAATCTEVGNSEYWYCPACGQFFADEAGAQILAQDAWILPATGHKWDAGKITTAPTATKKGVKTFTCTVCGETTTVELPTRNNQVATDGTKVGPGASEEVAGKAISGMKTDSDPAGSSFGLLRAKSIKQGQTYVKVSWAKVKGAKKYVIYGNACGKTNKMKKLATVKGNYCTFKRVITNKGKKVKVKKGTYYKFIIVALDGSRNVVSTSKVIHVATPGGKVGNDKVVTTKAKKNKVTVKVGKTFYLGAKAVPVSKKKTVKRHRGLAYETTNKAVATVTAKGTIVGKKKGTCSVYVYAQNGICKRISVTVK